MAIDNVPPGAAASLPLARTEVSNLSVPRFAIRGVVRTNPTASTTGTITPIAFVGCPVKTTLEIYNDDTGNTQLLTSDVQSIGGVVSPVVAARKQRPHSSAPLMARTHSRT